VVYSKFPEKQRKPTGMTWFTHKESGRQYVTVTGTGEGVYLVTENVDTDAAESDLTALDRALKRVR
jgi:hypothetical protein